FRARQNPTDKVEPLCFFGVSARQNFSLEETTATTSARDTFTMARCKQTARKVVSSSDTLSAAHTTTTTTTAIDKNKSQLLQYAKLEAMFARVGTADHMIACKALFPDFASCQLPHEYYADLVQQHHYMAAA